MQSEQRRSRPASFTQEQLWLVDQAMPGTGVNNDVRAWDLFGPLDVVVLRSCLDELVARHAALRTALRHERGRLWQVVQPSHPACFISLAAGDVSAALELLDNHVAEPIELSRGSALRAVLVRLSSDHHIFGLIVHHSACDAHSHTILREDLFETYTARISARQPALPARGACYLEFAELERREWQCEPDASLEWLKGLPQAAQSHAALRAERDRPLVGDVRSRQFSLPDHDLRRLMDRAADAAVTVNMAMTAIFGVALSRWTGSGKILFSSPIDIRPDPRFHRSVGVFVSSMPILLDVGGNPTFEELLRRARHAVLTSLHYARIPPGKIQTALAADRIGSDRMHKATLSVRKTGPTQFKMADVTAKERRIAPAWSLFGVSLLIELGKSDAEAYLDYDPAVFSDKEADRFGAMLSELVAAAPDAVREADLPRIPAQDWHQLESWSTGPAQPEALNLANRVAAFAQHTPDALAVRAEGTRLSYRSLWAEAGRYSQRLRELGVGAEDIVAIRLPRSVELIAAIVGTLRIGAAFMPLDTRDPDGRITRLLAGSGAAVLISAEPAMAAGWDGAVLLNDDLLTSASFAGCVPEASGDMDSLAYIINTSGSTGVPKGVMVTNRGIANYLDWAVAAYGITSGDTVPLHTSAAFDLAMTSMLGPLYVGAAVHVLREEAGPLGVVQHLSEGYRLLKATPSHMLALLEEAALDNAAIAPGVLVFGGESWSASQAERWAAQASFSTLVNEYGPTETTVGATVFTMTGRLESNLVPIGRPIRNTTAYVVDSDLHRVPVGVRGELVIGGAGVARGYRNAPALTAAQFVPDPFGRDGGRLYRTGDLAFWNDRGQLELIGRVDDQVKILGYRVEPGEVEGVLASCPDLRQAAVIAHRTQGYPSLAAFIVPNTTMNEAQKEQTRTWLREQLPAHMMPEVFVVMDQLPMNGSGKVNRPALVSLAKAHSKVAAGKSSRLSTHLREVVRAAWRDLLAQDSFSDDVTFFAAGGNSLMLFQLHAALRQRGLTQIAISDLFRFPTIAGITDRIAALSSRAGEGEIANQPPLPQLIRRPRRNLPEEAE